MFPWPPITQANLYYNHLWPRRSFTRPETEIVAPPITHYLIDGWLPARRVHLLGGPSGAGKTRWLLDTLSNHWERGHSVLGCSSHPVPWCYVAADRDLESVHETIMTLGLNPFAMKIIPAFGAHVKTWGQVLAAIGASGAELAVIESFGLFCEPPGNHWQVKQFLSSTYAALVPSRECPHGLTIIGVMESPKMKPNERYDNPRQRISGVATWSHSTETVMMLEPSNIKRPNEPGRTIYIRPRNYQNIDYTGMMTAEGHVIFTDRINP